MKRNYLRAMAGSLSAVMVIAAANPLVPVSATVRTGGRVSVHDPSIFKDKDGTYYVYGSHLANAKSKDLINWEQISGDFGSYDWKKDSIYGDILNNLSESFKWAGYDDGDCSGGGVSVWAPDVIYNSEYEWKDGSKGAYMIYYCASSTWRRSCIGYAVSKNAQGPFEYVDTVIYSGFTKTGATDGKSTRNTKWNNDYLNLNELIENKEIEGISDNWFDNEGGWNQNYAPNAIDPTVFYGADNELYMVYGSWSGGLFILELDEKTGDVIYPGKDSKDASGNTVDRYFGTHIAGGNHQSGEGPYIKYDKSTGYYYMYETYGGLTATGGYNMRLFRSKNVMGPYVDAAGNNAANSGKDNNKYGIKLEGNYQFLNQPGYRAAGHNSALIDDDGSHYLVSHQRFDEPANQTERHEVRVRQQFMNEDNWPVTAVYEYNGEKISHYEDSEVLGTYEIINHGTKSDGAMLSSKNITLNADGTVSGEETGTWKKTKTKDYDYITLKLGDSTYKGVFFKQQDETNDKNSVMTFSTIGDNNECIWGSALDTESGAVKISLAKTVVDASVPTNTNGDLKLIKEAKGATISWKSSNTKVISNDGKVTRQDDDVTVTLTATIKAQDVTKTFDYKVTVNGSSKVIYAYDFEKATNDKTISGYTQIKDSVNATLKGTAEIVKDEERGNVLSIVSPEEVYNTNMLQLPEDTFSNVTGKGYTVAMWVNCGADIFEHSALFNAMTAGTYPMTRIGVNLCGRINANGYIDGGYYNTVLRGTGWHHVAYGINSTGMKVWVDGKLFEASDKDLNSCFDKTNGACIQNSKDVRIGSGSPWVDRDIENAKFDDVVVYDGTLTDTEVQNLFEGKTSIKVSKPAKEDKPESNKKDPYTSKKLSGATVTGTAKKDGTFVDKNGFTIKNRIVKDSKGTRYIVDSKGKKITNKIVKSDKGTQYYVDKKGVVAVKKTVTVNKKKYYATSNGAFVVNKFYKKTPGKTIYATKSGELKVSTLFTVSKKKYYADKDGIIAMNKFATISSKSNKKVYADKKGVVAVNKVITVNKKKYVAQKDGVIAINKWVKIGKTTYFCNKKGVITKTKKA